MGGFALTAGLVEFIENSLWTATFLADFGKRTIAKVPDIRYNKMDYANKKENLYATNKRTMA